MNDKVILEAVRLVTMHFKDVEYFKTLRGLRFNYANDDALLIEQNAMAFNEIIYVKPYTTFSPWSKVIGYARGNVIYVNTRKLDLPLKDRVENIRHEIFHLQGYSHKGNRATEYNLKTVPYLGANLFVKYLESIGKI